MPSEDNNQGVEIPADLAMDPDVLAARKRNLLSKLKMQQAMNYAKTVGFFIHTFREESVNVIAGITTLVMGYFQIRKYSKKNKLETKTEAISHKPATMAAKKKMAKEMDVPVASIGSASTTVVMSSEISALPFQDMGNYAFIAALMVFTYTFVKIFIRKRKEKKTGVQNGLV